MKLLYTTKNGRMTVELEGKTQTDLMSQLADFQELFEQKAVVKVDGKFEESDDLRATVRTVTSQSDNKEYTYYEWRVNSGLLKGYRLTLGELNDRSGRLFPKRKDKEGKYLDNGGWEKWQGNRTESTPSTEQPAKTGKEPF